MKLSAEFDQENVADAGLDASHGLKFQEKHLVYDTLRLTDSVIGPL
ncbi:MAG: hypothetical protein VYA17_13535 [Pseudomonadota bacterium]|nr:hypothetical protein [Pseudomonadota bacterium]